MTSLADGLSALGESKLKKIQCERTVEVRGYHPNCRSFYLGSTYSQCHREAKFMVPKVGLGKKAKVCSMHRRSYDKQAKQNGWPLAEPLAKSKGKV